MNDSKDMKWTVAQTSLSNRAVLIILIYHIRARACSTCPSAPLPSPTSRWPRSTWTTCCARPCPIPSMGLGTGCGRRATRRCSRSFTGSSWRSSRSRRAPCADTCWTHSDCAARKSTDCPQRRTQTSPFILNACSLHGDFLFYFILNHPFNASFETYNLFYWNTGAFQGQWINVSFI